MSDRARAIGQELAETEEQMERLNAALDGRYCPSCWADVIGNDPHQPGCEEGSVDVIGSEDEDEDE